jgi:hypothetical protein
LNSRAQDNCECAYARQTWALHLGAGHVVENASLQIHSSVAEGCALFVRLLQETKPHAGRALTDAREDIRTESLDENPRWFAS